MSGLYHSASSTSASSLLPSVCTCFAPPQNATFDIGTDNASYGYGGTGKKSHAKNFEDYGGAYGLNDVIGCYLDLEAGQISYAKNGKDLGAAFSIPRNVRGECGCVC
jgi:hypothetical protein